MWLRMCQRWTAWLPTPHSTLWFFSSLSVLSVIEQLQLYWDHGGLLRANAEHFQLHVMWRLHGSTGILDFSTCRLESNSSARHRHKANT